MFSSIVLLFKWKHASQPELLKHIAFCINLKCLVEHLNHVKRWQSFLYRSWWETKSLKVNDGTTFKFRVKSWPNSGKFQDFYVKLNHVDFLKICLQEFNIENAAKHIYKLNIRPTML